MPTVMRIHPCLGLEDIWGLLKVKGQTSDPSLKEEGPFGTTTETAQGLANGCKSSYEKSALELENQ